ncbi:MAG: hypothetical protein AAF617_06320 [Bacteroidota bacterium]
MSTTYTSLFKLSVAHSYYASGLCECMRYEATQETNSIFQKYGMLLRIEQSGFEVYTTTNQALETYLNYVSQVSQQTAFVFSGIVTDANFHNFTNVPMDEIGVLSYESDQTLSEASSETIQLQETFIQKDSTQKALSITIKIADIIQWQQTSDHVQFNIQLQARETQWNYYIINNSNQEYNKLEIQSTEPTIAFTGSTAVTLQNGQNALLFTSNNPQIPLKNEVTYQFNLINTRKTIAGERQEIVVKGLPIPNPQNLQIQDDLTIASLMYVYI